jgi:hypothetical protein
MPIYKICVTAEYANGIYMRRYSVDAPDVEQAKQEATVSFGPDEFDASRGVPTQIQIDEIR